VTPSTSEALLAGRFEIGARIGQGGMGTVFRGVDTQMGEAVAIKLLNAESVLSDRGNLERFAREGEALRRLNHPNIVKVLATVRDGERHYLVMEWVGGGSLEDVLKSGEAPLPVDRVLRIALDLSDALTRSHRLEIIHRDLKPANVLIADDGTPRLTDFGVAHVVGEKSVTLPNAIVGTLDYMSPEVLRGESVDVRTDVWAFGVLLFEMLTRVRPFSAGHFAQTLYAIANKAAPDLEALRPDCPAALVDLIYRMLEKHRDQRIPSVRQVGAELENILMGRSSPVLPHAPTQPHRAWHGTEREPAASPELPTEITPFIGRVEELAKLAWLLVDPDARLITIVAPGGMGKTRFALEASRRILGRMGDFGETSRTVTRFTDGVFFVPLASLGSPELVIAAIADAIGLELHRGREPAEQLLGYVRNKAMLLVFDNFEHVLESAGVVGDILRVAPRSIALATSRERLGLSGETIFELGSMEVPGPKTPEDLLGSSAVNLFVTCARRVQADFELSTETTEAVTRVCRLVGGMPLGIVLAASWVGVMTPVEIADEIGRSFDFLTTEMRDVPERQRSLRAAFDHSWKLLDEQQRATFSRLCVFRGGFSRKAAETVAEASIRTLAALTNKSLLRRDPSTGRYEMHEMLRQYAEERLGESPGSHERTLDLHADYYARFLAERTERLNEREPFTALDEIETEIDNVRAAWKHMLAHEQLSSVASAIPTLKKYYRYRGTFIEAEAVFGMAARSLEASCETLTGEQARLLGVILNVQCLQCEALGHNRQALDLGDRALLLLDESAHPSERACVVYAVGLIHSKLGDRKQGTRRLDQALALFRAKDEPIGVVWALATLGNVQAWAGDYRKAEGPLRESIAFHAQASPSESDLSFFSSGVVELHGLIGLGLVMAGRGDYEESCRLLSLGLQMNEEFKDILGTLGGQRHLASALRSLGDYAEAEAQARGCLKLSQEVGASDQEVWCWLVLGDVLKDQGQYADAAACFEKAHTLGEGRDNPQLAAAARLRYGDLALLQGDYARAEANFSHDLALFEELETFWGIVPALCGLGYVACHRGDYVVARERFGRALTTALACKAQPLANRVAAGIALSFAKTGQTVRAAELLERIRSDSATERSTHTQRIDPLLAQLEKELPPDELAAVLERGKTFDLEALSDELVQTKLTS
jgi:serine/threonine protein kinase/predicted ATPase